MAPKVAIIIYSTYQHITTLAQQVKQGVQQASGDATILQIAETLPKDILQKMHAPPKQDFPVASPQTLTEYDAFLFGFPTRFGTFPAQVKAFWDATGSLWASGALHGKPYGMFVSTATPGGGTEATILNSISVPSHHGMVYVPLGYKNTFPLAAKMDELHAGSAYGASTFAAPDGSRQPSKLELEVAEIQGRSFYEIAKKF